MLAAHHDGDGAVDGLGLATGDRGVHEVDAQLLEALGEVAARERRDGAHVDDGLAGGEALGEQGGFDVGGVLHHRDDDVGLLGDVLAGRASDGAGVNEALDAIGIQVERDDLVARLEDVLSHRGAHDAETDETNVHVSVLSFERARPELCNESAAGSCCLVSMLPYSTMQMAARVRAV